MDQVRRTSEHPKSKLWHREGDDGRSALTGGAQPYSMNAHEMLVAEGIRLRLISMPSWDIFDDQPQEYRDSVLPPAVKARVAVEQASTLGWERYVGASGQIIGMKTFGASAPLRELENKFGFEPERLVDVAKEILGRGKS